MKLRACFFLYFIIFSSSLFAQEQSKRLNFILLIDNEIPVASVYDGFFLIKDSAGIKDKIPFDYQVGGLVMSSSNYRKLFLQYSGSEIDINFKYRKLDSNSDEAHEYKKKIPEGWMNEMYIIFKVYNYYNKESRKKYFLKKDDYGIEISVPGAGSVIPIRQ
jgi:hypothetical protein